MAIPLNVRKKTPRRNRRASSVPVLLPQPKPAIAERAPTAAEGIINILIVDDEPRNLTVLETVLDDPSYRLVRAESADQALLALVAEDFALLILDIRMPGMTGFELAQMIKGRKKTAAIPIIFLTAYYNDDQHVLEGYGSGAVDYLHKPVNAPVLRSKVAVFAELYRRSREVEIANRVLHAEVAERRKAQEQLRELNETLEQRVTERSEALLKASTALTETDARYRSLFDSSLDAIISLGIDGRFESANPAALKLIGRSLEELKSIHFLDVCVPDQSKVVEQAFQAAFRHECITIDTAVITASGERRDLFISGAPAMVGGKLAGLSCIARDITDRKQAERELKAAKVAAEKANVAKSNFLSSMSHELRTPLNAILGFAQILHTDAPTPSQKQSVDEILNAGWYLLELINEVLDLVRIESGKLALVSEPTSLTEIMHECLAMIEPQAKKRGINVSCPSIDLPCFVYGDRVRLKQAIINLLSNAIKYNKRDGSVVMDCIEIAPGRMRVVIKDSGVGLTPEQMAQLFQPFNRLGQEGGTEEGTGIGLVVTKQLVELMGGTIGVESTVGEGSVFWIELNQTVDPECPLMDSSAAAPAAALAGGPLRTVLYVEDNPANFRLVENIIARRADLNLLSAMDGERGIEIARTARPDVILIDINLPGISGIDAMNILRADPLTAHIPVVALTANAMPLDIDKGMQAGFFRYLTKPIKVAELMLTVDMALKTIEQASPDASNEGGE